MVIKALFLPQLIWRQAFHSQSLACYMYNNISKPQQKRKFHSQNVFRKIWLLNVWRSGSSVSFQWDVPKQTWPHYHVGSESNRKSSKSDFYPKVLCVARSSVEDETRNMNRINCNENCFSILDENNDRDGAEWWPWSSVKPYSNFISRMSCLPQD